MDTRVRWIENAAFVAETGSGHAFVIDGPESIGGRNLGPRPMELLLAGVGSCASVDIVRILEKSRQPLQACEVRVQATRAATDPKVFTAIHLHFIVTGTGLSQAHVARAVTLSAEKYCSASIMLGATAKVTHDYEIMAPTVPGAGAIPANDT